MLSRKTNSTGMKVGATSNFIGIAFQVVRYPNEARADGRCHYASYAIYARAKRVKRGERKKRAERAKRTDRNISDLIFATTESTQINVVFWVRQFQFFKSTSNALHDHAGLDFLPTARKFFGRKL